MLTPRDPQAFAGERYDLVVVGGGIYGIMVALEAARRGLRPIVLERGDFGAATSHNSLRIVHGGLRYLQTADIKRFYEHVSERRWFLRAFPDLVVPLPCLMPMYGDGVHRGSLVGALLALNDLMSWHRNRAVDSSRALPASRILPRDDVPHLFPGVDPAGLKCGALWYDGFAVNAPRLVMEALRWARAYGAAALNYVEASGLVCESGCLSGVRARDVLSGEELTFRAPVVINAGGPWSRSFAALCGAERRELFEASIAWNIVFRRPALSEAALAVRARRRGAQIFMLVPWKGALLAGTGHAPWSGDIEHPRPDEALLSRYIEEINEAVPGLDLGMGEIDRVFAGLLPATGPGSHRLANREVVADHRAEGLPEGFFSLSGVKLTTARRVADKVLRRAFPSARPRPAERFARPKVEDEPPDYPYSWMPREGDNEWTGPLSRVLAEEGIIHLDDLLMRRSSLGDNPKRAVALAPKACTLFDWDDRRRAAEIERLRHSLGLRAPHLQET